MDIGLIVFVFFIPQSSKRDVAILSTVLNSYLYCQQKKKKKKEKKKIQLLAYKEKKKKKEQALH